MSKPDDDSDPETPRHATLQAALDLIDQGLTLIDRDLRLVAWNRTFLQLLEFLTPRPTGAHLRRFSSATTPSAASTARGDIDEVVRGSACRPHAPSSPTASSGCGPTAR